MHKVNHVHSSFIQYTFTHQFLCASHIWQKWLHTRWKQIRQLLLLLFDSFYSSKTFIVPPPHPTIPFSLLSSCSLFYFHPCSRAPLTERPGHIHMSHRFMEIPIVFSQCAPLRGPWVACVSQHGLIYPNSTPHYFTRLSHTMPHMQPHLEKCRCACKM